MRGHDGLPKPSQLIFINTCISGLTEQNYFDCGVIFALCLCGRPRSSHAISTASASGKLWGAREFVERRLGARAT